MLARWDRPRSLPRRWPARLADPRDYTIGRGHGYCWEQLHRLGLAGNVVILAAIVLVCCNSDLLLSERRGPVRSLEMARGAAPVRAASLATEADAGGGGTERLVLVVIDGLRADTAFDPQQMPILSRLADRHGRRTARVESLIPSSIAGIRTIATGNVPPPISFLSDFGAGSAQQGGVLQAIAAAGGRCFVAGPTLWTDLYGEWIAAGELDASFGVRDEQLTVAAVAAIRSDQYRLVVLHLGRLDMTAHHAGNDSAEYAAAANACDRAIADVHAALPPDTGLIVTSDHGNTRTGGHAGPEPAVLTTPLVVAGVHTPAVTAEVPQSRLAELISQSLGVAEHMPVDEPSHFHVDLSSIERISLMGLATLCGLALCSAISGRSCGSRQAFVLNSAVWLSLGLAVFDHVGTALLVGTAAFAAAAISTGYRLSPAVVGCCVIGAVIGALRLWDGSVALHESRPYVRPLMVATTGLAAPVALGHAPLAVVFLLSVAAGKGLSGILRWTSCYAVGGGVLAATYVILSRLLGETVSLSSIDVRMSVCLVHWPGGLLWACLVVIACQAIPAAGLLLGSRSVIVGMTAKDFGRFASAVAAVLLGQLLIVAGLFADAYAGQAMESLGLGLLIRVIAESCYLFFGLLCVLHVNWLSLGALKRPLGVTGRFAAGRV